MEKFVNWIFTQRNKERLLKYGWVISAIRTAIGLTILFLLVTGKLGITYYRP